MPWYEINGAYSKINGINVSVNGVARQLTNNEINYLLIEIDGYATVSSMPPQNISFLWGGQNITVSNKEWSLFQDSLSSAVGAGGWQHAI